MKRISRGMLLAGALALSACQSPPRIDVEEQWADTMSRLNMFGFYPQSEDVQVGDIFLHAPSGEGRPTQARFSLARLVSFAPNAVLNELQGQQGRHGQLPPSSQDVGNRLRIMPLPPLPATGQIRQITSTADCGGYDIGHADESRCLVRMQRATIPGHQVGRITEGQLGAAGLLGNFGAQIGLGTSSETAVNITLRNVQDISLDTWRLSRLRSRHWGQVANLIWAEDLLALLREMRPDLLPAACNGDPAALNRAGVEIMMINRVVYAGGIEYGFTRNATTAIRAAVDLQSVLAGQPQAPEIPALASPPARAATPANATPREAAGARLAGLLQAMTGQPSGGRAGANLSFGIGTYGNLTLNEDFNRLVAVGAGSRLRFSFHEMLAGRIIGQPSQRPEDSRFASLEDLRFHFASIYCQATLGERFDPAGLARAMGVVRRS